MNTQTELHRRNILELRSCALARQNAFYFIQGYFCGVTPQ
jgi:hypothetical protein